MTTHPAVLPLPPEAARDHTGDRVAARVLRRSLLPGAPAPEVVAELVALAGGRREPIIGALGRIERARTGRQNAVVDRAESYLSAALALVHRDGTAHAA
jgi:hypothetical protein